MNEKQFFELTEGSPILLVFSVRFCTDTNPAFGNFLCRFEICTEEFGA